MIIKQPKGYIFAIAALGSLEKVNDETAIDFLMIGHSFEVIRRFKEIERCSPCPMKIVRVISEVSVLERDFYRTHKDKYQIKGKWYKPSVLSVFDKHFGNRESALDNPIYRRYRTYQSQSATFKIA